MEPPAGGLAADADVLAVHAALVAAQEEAAEARDELARMVTEAERTREQAKRERARRESDAARLHESMSTLRRLAEDSLQKEREATRAMSAQLDDTEASLAALRTETAPLREQAQVAFAGRDEAAEQVGVQRAEIERLGSKLDHLARDAREISERARVEVEQARARLLQQERALAASRAELEELRAAYDSARQEAARAGAKLASSKRSPSLRVPRRKRPRGYGTSLPARGKRSSVCTPRGFRRCARSCRRRQHPQRRPPTSSLSLPV